MMTRRRWIAQAAGAPLFLAACGPRKGTAFPGFAVVALEAEQALSTINLERFRVTRQLRLEGAPSQVIALTTSRVVLCLIPTRGTLLAIDSEGFAIRQKVRVGDLSLTMRVSDDGQHVSILNQSPPNLVSVDLSNFSVSQRVRLPAVPASADFFGRIAAVTLPGSGSIAIVEDGRVSRSIATGIAPEMICFRPNGSAVLACDPNQQMMAIGDPATGQLMVNLALPLKPRRYCYNSDGGQLFITGDGMDAVCIVSPYQTEVDETILAGRIPAGMAAPRPDKNTPAYLFVTNSGSGDVTVIDIDSRTVVARIPVGQDPQDVLITPDNQYALVLNRKSGDIAVIRVPSIEAWGNLNHKTASLFTMIPVGLGPVSATISRA